VSKHIQHAPRMRSLDTMDIWTLNQIKQDEKVDCSVRRRVN